MSDYCDGCNREMDERGFRLQRSGQYQGCRAIMLCVLCAQTLFLAIKLKYEAAAHDQS